MLRAIAIDDEPMALEIIRKFAAAVPYLNIISYFNDGQSAIDFLQQEKVDLQFLDIRMPDMSGLQLMKKLADPPLTIFTTAYSEHAVKGFELNAVDYLLKPFTPQRFEEACEKARRLQEWKIGRATEDSGHILVKSGSQQVKLLLHDILYVQSAGNYVQFVLSKEKLLVRLTMNEAASLLPPHSFTRIHRSYIVSNARVTRIDRNAVQIAQEWIPVGVGYTDIARKILGG